MREFELYGTVKAVVSICDSINYILEEDNLREVFSLVNNYLDPKGMFIFDLNTKYKYEQMGEIPIGTVNLRRYIIRERMILRRSAAYWKRQAWSL